MTSWVREFTSQAQKDFEKKYGKTKEQALKQDESKGFLDKLQDRFRGLMGAKKEDKLNLVLREIKQTPQGNRTMECWETPHEDKDGKPQFYSRYCHFEEEFESPELKNLLNEPKEEVWWKYTNQIEILM